ncbi:HTH-type transcriptional regulator PgrR [Cupriavidus yeoncheonensis]|uniref:HTH-type transcriptional regulator PgrR n=1 Tax=Cupriavidus yeoncheonensis TaxID=1462994 RepID=A0A916IUI1_9BURK|nr:LysR family transcriptional regulator [Cupriavidus yeoncheonensis]CAG2134454.1 HTH-type transcriptional regulator PgrR [Cupriavidus yeoncheonensis]
MPAFTRTELADLNVFVTICRRRSFRQAAVELGVSTSALSHAMRNLEARLGVKLLNRTSRSVVPTAAGSALAEQLDQGFETIGAAIDQLDRYRTSPVGRLRINVPRDASRLLIGPVLPAFIAAYPEIQLDITVDDRLIDIIADGYDAGIRYGDTVAGDMIAVPLTPPLRWVVVGAPAYLARNGRPAQPADLMRHACIRIRIGDNSLYRWELGNGRRALELDVPGPVSANETDTAVDAALNGVGLAYCLERRVADDIAAGRLEVVLPKWAVAGPPMVMYYPSRRQTLPGLRQLIDMIRTANT